MLRKGHILAIVLVSISLVTILSIEAQESGIPQWIKNTALWWGQGNISDSDFISAMKFLIEQNIIQISAPQNTGDMQVLENNVLSLSKENQMLKGDMKVLEYDLSILRGDYNELAAEYDKLYDSYLYYYNLRSSSSSGNSYYEEPSEANSLHSCSGSARCITGYVTDIVDGDTIKVDGQSIRFSLVNTPEYGQEGYELAVKFIGAICPRGSPVLVDEDDGQTEGSYGRMIAVVYCNNINLSQAVLEQGYGEILKEFCSESEFAGKSWAQNYGCAYKESAPTQQPKKESTPKTTPPSQTEQPSCDPSYPDFCIPPPPPDLNCSDIPQKRFTVYQPDPHRFDGDKDGIGCES